MLKKSLSLKGAIMRAKQDLELPCTRQSDICMKSFADMKRSCFKGFFLGIKVLKNQEFTNIEIFSVSTRYFNTSKSVNCA